MRAGKMIRCGGATTGALEPQSLAWTQPVAIGWPRGEDCRTRAKPFIGRSTSGQPLELSTNAIGETSRSALVDDFDAVLQDRVCPIQRHLRAIALGHTRNALALRQVANDERMVSSQRIDREGRPRHRTVALEHAVVG